MLVIIVLDWNKAMYIAFDLQVTSPGVEVSLSTDNIGVSPIHPLNLLPNSSTYGDPESDMYIILIPTVAYEIVTNTVRLPVNGQ